MCQRNGTPLNSEATSGDLPIFLLKSKFKIITSMESTILKYISDGPEVTLKVWPWSCSDSSPGQIVKRSEMLRSLESASLFVLLAILPSCKKKKKKIYPLEHIEILEESLH